MTTITLQNGKYSFKDNTFVMSEKDVKFDTTYKVVNPATNKFMVFEFKNSTGPEFDSNTKWIYKSDSGLTLEVCNDANMVKQAANAYLQHKLAK